MMKTINIFFPLIFLLLSLFSCTKTIEYTGTELNEQLVLFSYGQVGQKLEIHLTHSQFSLARTQDNLFVNDAQVTYSINGNAFESMNSSGKGVYTSQYVVTKGDLVMIKVTHPNYPNIQATAKVPLKCNYASSIIEKGNDYAVVELTLNDSQKDNYYNISGVAVFDAHYTNGDDLNAEITKYSSIDPLLKQKRNGVSLNGSDPKSYFLDETFQGEKRKIRIRFDCTENDLYNYNNNNVESLTFKQVKIDLSELSYSYYAYKTSIDKYYQHDSDIFAEKTQIYSNVENGLGVLAFRTPHIIVINN